MQRVAGAGSIVERKQELVLPGGSSGIAGRAVQVAEAGIQRCPPPRQR